MIDDSSSYLVYDGECPFCSSYVRLVRLREAVGKITLVSARDDHPVVQYVKDRGVILDQEMALVIKGEVFSGADCINQIALMSTSSGIFNKANAIIFSSRGVSRFLYPVLRLGRNAALFILGRKKIDE